ncbi:MAG: WYL domain-containing protein, partial [Hymenobacteraceae bacterium]|nr:WYL domain-containing protein [Hymenobacteraceae bacterium]
FVQFDARRHGTGTQHLRPLLRAVQVRREVQFAHRKHWDDAPTTRRVWPLGLKEWASRWYLLALNQPGGAFRSFGLGRMRDLSETGAAFPLQSFDAATYFRDCFGVTRPDDGTEPVDLELAFTWAQGRYVEDQPLHPSQITLQRSFEDDEISVRLRIYWTHEVLMALLAYGNEVAVLAPAAVQAEVAAAHRTAAG